MLYGALVALRKSPVMTSGRKDLLESVVKAHFWSLNFAPDVEKTYRAHRVEENHKHVAVLCFLCTFIDASFLISDYFCAYDYFHIFLIGRLLIITPVLILISFLLWNKSPLHDALNVTGSVTVTAVHCYLTAAAEGQFHEPYMFGTIFVMIVGCVLGRPRNIYAVISVVLQFAIFVIAVEVTSFTSQINKLMYILYCATGAVVSVMTVYTLEKFDRRTYLLQLRVTLLNRELEAQSLTDPLTKLANRRSFEQATARHWQDSSSRSQPISFVLIDIDRFKAFNDTYGHSAGDLCLVKIASCVAAQMPKARGLAVRFGGEELLLFLPATDFMEAREIAERARLAIAREGIPHSAAGQNGVVSASFGVATAAADDCDAAELVIRADTALYAAKRSGRNQVWPPLNQAVDESSPRVTLAQNAA